VTDDAITFDPAQHTPMDCQFLLSQLVVPRPIAMVSTRSPQGGANVAPMSYFLPITGVPMLVGVTMGLREDAAQKHSYLNAMASGDFAINITSMAMAEHIETVAMECPPEVDEFGLAGWTAVPCTKISSPAVAEAPARLECVVRQVVELGAPGVPFGEVHLVIAEVVWATYHRSILNDRGRIDPMLLQPVGRLGLRSFIHPAPDAAFEIPRIPWDDWVAPS
jgi:flavin reductase (DIM6/NTAB) family NADH-FMN oxidoreductase RutF